MRPTGCAGSLQTWSPITGPKAAPRFVLGYRDFSAHRASVAACVLISGSIDIVIPSDGCTRNVTARLRLVG